MENDAHTHTVWAARSTVRKPFNTFDTFAVLSEFIHKLVPILQPHHESTYLLHELSQTVFCNEIQMVSELNAPTR